MATHNRFRVECDGWGWCDRAGQDGHALDVEPWPRIDGQGWLRRPLAVAYQSLEDQVSAQPPITVPTVVIDPQRDTLVPAAPSREAHEERFPALLDVRPVRAGHNVPQEAPQAFADAVLRAHHKGR